MARCFPRLYAAASLKRATWGVPGRSKELFSAALCRGLIEARLKSSQCQALSARFPRLYAAASLKRPSMRSGAIIGGAFSAALCRGLIEAIRLFLLGLVRVGVFRGFMPRPH